MSQEFRGILITLADAHALERAAQALLEAGFREFDAISPFALEGVFPAEPGERARSWNLLGALTLAAGLTGMATGFTLQWIANSWAFPLNSGGRPYFSWPNFVPITFVLSILFAAGATFLGFILFLRLPEPHHVYFESSQFGLHRERYYLFVSRRDRLCNREAIASALGGIAVLAEEELAA